MKNRETSENGYRKGHPWYYLLGGKPPKLKEIRQEAQASGYRGYLADHIDKADQMQEPKRSAALRKYRERALQELGRDIRIYREVARDLHRYQAEQNPDGEPNCCDSVHTAMSLKYNHLYSDFAHLHVLDELLSRQRDLFDF